MQLIHFDAHGVGTHTSLTDAFSVTGLDDQAFVGWNGSPYDTENLWNWTSRFRNALGRR